MLQSLFDRPPILTSPDGQSWRSAHYVDDALDLYAVTSGLLLKPSPDARLSTFQRPTACPHPLKIWSDKSSAAGSELEEVELRRYDAK